jgi:hypothetical protein
MKGGSRNIPLVDSEFFPYRDKYDNKTSTGIFEKPKEKPIKENAPAQNNIYEKITNPYKNYPGSGNTMPGSYSINLNLPNIMPTIPQPTQPIIPMMQMGYNGYPLYAPAQPDIIKKYSINISTGDLGSINSIYEDMLPKNNTVYERYTTIKERKSILSYYGSHFAKYYATNTNLSSSDNKTYNLSDILAHFKLSKLNPYYLHNTDGNNVGGTNDVGTTNVNFFMFVCCNPIKYVSSNNTISCDDESIRSHIRIYNLEIKGGSELYNRINQELEYYNKITDIVKSFKCPNFVIKYGHIITVCKLDFNKINMLRINDYTDEQKIKKAKEAIQANLSTESNNHRCCLILTEGNNYNITDWYRNQFIKDSKNENIFIQVHVGQYSIEVWHSVIFQILVSLYILKNSQINITKFSFEDNVFIKKINITPGHLKYWKYIINGIPYYVPNHGYLVMIDINFTQEIKLNMDPNFDHTIFIPERSAFHGEDDVKELFDKIRDLLISNTNIEDIILKLFYSYIFDKLGQQISVQQEELSTDKQFKKGDIVLYRKNSNYIISYYLEFRTDRPEGYRIKTNNDLNNNNYKCEDDETVPEEDIYKYKYKENITKEIIETYIIKYD